MIPSHFRAALFVQLSYAGLAIVWQLVGVALLTLDRPALGPTADLKVAGQAAVIAAFYVMTLRRSPGAFTLLSIGSGLLAASVIRNTFLMDPDLWPRPGTRALSLAINSVGILGMALTLRAYLRWRRARPHQAPTADPASSPGDPSA